MLASAKRPKKCGELSPAFGLEQLVLATRYSVCPMKALSNVTLNPTAQLNALETKSEKH